MRTWGMAHQARRAVNVTTAIVISVFTLIVAMHPPALGQQLGQQCLGDCSRQDVVNAQITARVDSEQSRIDDVTRRVEKIEGLKPDALVEHMKTLDERFADQQKLLWAIVVGIIVNLLTSVGSRFPKPEAMQAIVEGITK